MHKYLKSIGYGNIVSKTQLNAFLKEAQTAFTSHELIALDPEMDFCEYRRECCPGIGVSLCGDQDMSENFERKYYFPYFIGGGITSYADVTVEKHMDREAYVGICEDVKVGISLIFYVQNAVEYMIEAKNRNGKIDSKSVTLSGLCNGGTILLPILKNAEQRKLKKEESRNRRTLLSAAKNGDPAAIESLTLEDIDIYSQVSRRLITEDIFSIVDTYFMPYGIECDRYSVMGEILEIRTVQNKDTGEELYIMKLDVNELQFDILVPVREIVGEPEVGRRFKGNIWLQGQINF